MFSFNGIGTTLYGCVEIPDIECDLMDIPHGSYMATMWFVFVYFPIIPLSSHIVVGSGDDDSSAEFQMIKLDKIYWRQVLHTYLCALGIVLGIFLIFRMIGISLAWNF